MTYIPHPLTQLNAMPPTDASTYDANARLNPAEEINEDGASTKPFTEQPAYGYGLWRNPINFVPASSGLPPTVSPPNNSLAEKYLAIVFPNGQPQQEESAFPLCGTCGAPVKEADTRAHYLSSVHQLSLPRANTPSSIDRTRFGLKYMEKHGWDVDARIGLGAEGQGMLFPIVPKEKRNTHGLGVQIKKGGRVVEKKVQTLDAGKVRKMVESEKKKDERLRRMFYGDEKVEKYLGQLGG
jgi:hypothetical protein